MEYFATNLAILGVLWNKKIRNPLNLYFFIISFINSANRWYFGLNSYFGEWMEIVRTPMQLIQWKEAVHLH